MKRGEELETRLVQWGDEYRGGRYDNTGWPGISPLHQLMKYHGRPPQGLNPRRIETNGPADIVELAVRALERQAKGYAPAGVLRCEYFATSYSRSEKLSRLSRLGARMDSARYSQHLRLAKIHVAAWLHIGFDDPLGEDEQVAMLEHVVQLDDAA